MATQQQQQQQLPAAITPNDTRPSTSISTIAGSSSTYSNVQQQQRRGGLLDSRISPFEGASHAMRTSIASETGGSTGGSASDGVQPDQVQAGVQLEDPLGRHSTNNGSSKLRVRLAKLRAFFTNI